MLKAEKERIVAELTERLRSTDTLIVTDYRGLTMSEIDDLRTKLLEHGARFAVVKNTLTRRAAEAAGADSVLALLEGPTAIAFLESGGDPVAVAKALSDTARTTRVLAIRGGLLDGRSISEEDVANLATLPPAETIRAQLAWAIVAPLATIVGLFTAPLRDLVGVLDARIRQLEERETMPEPAAEAEIVESTEDATPDSEATEPSETSGPEAQPPGQEEGEES